MEKKNKIIVSVLIGCLVAVILGGGILWWVNEANSFKPLKAGPLATDAVIGNGGSTVQKGDYLYFVYGYVERSEIKYKQNEYNQVKNYGAIYRTKLVNGVPQMEEAEDGTSWLKSMELVVPKIAAFDKTALYIYGNHLFYTSPNNQKNRYGHLQTERVDFFRVNLNGANHKKIYTTSGEVSLENFTFVRGTNGVVSLVVRDGSSIYAIQAAGGRSSDFGIVTPITNKANSMAIPQVTSYYSDNADKIFSGIMSNIFYTELDDNGNSVLKAWNFSTRKESLSLTDGKIYSVISLSNSTLLYTIALNSAFTAEGFVANNIETIEGGIAEQVTTGGIGQAYLPTTQVSGLGLDLNDYIISVINSKIFIETVNIADMQLLSGDLAVNDIVAIRGTDIYFLAEGELYRTSVGEPICNGDCTCAIDCKTPINTLIERNSMMALDVNQNYFAYAKAFTNNSGNTFTVITLVNLSNGVEYHLGREADRN
ncbi:MAG: hypothetical protein FWD32_00630 [Firmicutes bacterium]|nr:hypothetical protein [Bacillota bacterium]